MNDDLDDGFRLSADRALNSDVKGDNAGVRGTNFVATIANLSVSTETIFFVDFLDHCTNGSCGQARCTRRNHIANIP